ncbi:MAG: hypothetical protein QXS24_00765 [Desulfurococcaceae archaeon]
MKEIDLSKELGCQDNPVSKLLKLLDEGREEFVILIKKSTMPFEIAKIIAARKQYSVELVGYNNDELRIKFKKTRNK